MTLKIFIIISLLFLSGCGMFTPKEEEIGDTTYITKWRVYDCGNPPARDPIAFRPIPKGWWLVTNEGNYVLSAAEYGDLGENMQENKKGASQLKQEIEFYEDCIAKAKEIAD
jgi:hypothetical protein